MNNTDYIRFCKYRDIKSYLSHHYPSSNHLDRNVSMIKTKDSRGVYLDE